ncbi:MAG: acetoin utilization protein AcuC [Gammaproteobacteria bacterium]|jgi:acetoin utilization protein AcuC
MKHTLCVYRGAALARYGFGHGHPFSPDRLDAFYQEFQQQQLAHHPAITLCDPCQASQEQIEWFHDHDYVEKVKQLSEVGLGFLDNGDTPAVKGIYEAAATVVGTVLDGMERIMAGRCDKVFIPIAGLHHASRNSAAGFCVFNDCGVVIEALRRCYNIKKIAYVDIDAHHGDGVFYSFENDPDLYFADFHEDGHYLYPGTGFDDETGKGPAKGTKLNINMPPDSNDEDFLEKWSEVEAFFESHAPEFVLFQCGADSIAGDPITHLRYTPQSHAYAAERLCYLADKYAQGRLLVMGGGGYNHKSLARAWCAVVDKMANYPGSTLKKNFLPRSHEEHEEI